MKYFFKLTALSLFILTAFFSNPKASFAEYESYVFKIPTVSGTSFIATLSGVPSPESYKDKFKICGGTTLTNMVCPSETFQIKEVVDGAIKWTVPPGFLLGKSTYYVQAQGDFTPAYKSTPIKIITGNEKLDADWPLTASTDGTSAYISGVVHNLNPSDLTAVLQYSTVAFKDTLDETLPVNAREVKAQKDRGHIDLGIGTDGRYGFSLKDLSQNTTYAFRQIIKSDTRGIKEIKIGSFNSKTGITLEGSASQVQSFDQRSYRLLAPLPGLDIILDQDLCREQITQGKRPAGSCDNQISDFINLLIKIMIGLSAVVLVVQLIIQGYSYMVTDTPFKKMAAKGRFFDALFGLLLAMAAYLILNTINPNLVSSELNVEGINLSVIEDFDVSGVYTGSFDVKPIKVNFNKVAYPAALAASKKTGVDVSFILAIFAQETGSGRNLGTCVWDKQGVMPGPQDKSSGKSKRDDQTAYLQIMSELKLAPGSKSVSCPAPGGGWGGGIGFTQFIPTTWLEQRVESRALLGYGVGQWPNPWELKDAIMTSAVYLKKLGAVSDPRNAACKYYSGRSCDSKKPVNAFYGDQVMGKKLSIEKQITASIAKGEIKP